MSASEKLKALNEATPLEKYEIDLFRVLPQIISVVEAAELLVTEAQGIHNPEYPSRLKSYYAASPALAALDKELT